MNQTRPPVKRGQSPHRAERDGARPATDQRGGRRDRPIDRRLFHEGADDAEVFLGFGADRHGMHFARQSIALQDKVKKFWRGVLAQFASTRARAAAKDFLHSHESSSSFPPRPLRQRLALDLHGDFKGPLGLQLYSLRDTFKTDPHGGARQGEGAWLHHRRTLQQPAAGAGEVEGGMLAERGITAVSGHFGYDALKKDLAGSGESGADARAEIRGRGVDSARDRQLRRGRREARGGGLQ